MAFESVLEQTARRLISSELRKFKILELREVIAVAASRWSTLDTAATEPQQIVHLADATPNQHE